VAFAPRGTDPVAAFAPRGTDPMVAFAPRGTDLYSLTIETQKCCNSRCRENVFRISKYYYKKV
ncbi:MAG: hypothetical protein WCX60_02465, partial [Anaerovoracaceae bacterium]